MVALKLPEPKQRRYVILDERGSVVGLIDKHSPSDSWRIRLPGSEAGVMVMPEAEQVVVVSIDTEGVPVLRMVFGRDGLGTVEQWGGVASSGEAREGE